MASHIPVRVDVQRCDERLSDCVNNFRLTLFKCIRATTILFGMTNNPFKTYS